MPDSRAKRDGRRRASGGPGRARASVTDFHPAWLDLIRFCGRIEHGEISNLKIQNGVPVLAEVTTKKVKFG